MSRFISLLVRLLPADLRARNGEEIVADLELIQVENGRLAAREVGGFIAESLRLRSVGKTLAGSIVTSLTWSLGLLVGVAGSELRVTTKDGALISAVILAGLLMFCFWSTRTFLWVAAVLGAISISIGVAIDVFVAIFVADKKWYETFFHPGFAASCLIVLVGSLVLRRSPANLKPAKWSLWAIPCGVALGMFHIGASLYALTVLVALILAYWNPHPAIVLTAVPWLVGVGPIAVFEMFTHRATGATAANLLGMLALATIAMGWVVGNHRRNLRRSLQVYPCV
jgi:hypothetical protein